RLRNLVAGMHRAELAVAAWPVGTTEPGIGESDPGPEHDEAQGEDDRKRDEAAKYEALARAGRARDLDLGIRVHGSADTGDFEETRNVLLHPARVRIDRKSHHEVTEGIDEVDVRAGISGFAGRETGGEGLRIGAPEPQALVRGKQFGGRVALVGHDPQ